MKNKMTLCVVLLLLSILSGCGKDSGNTSGLESAKFKLDPKVYTLPTEQEAAEYFEFFVKAINAGDFAKIDETIDPAALHFFKPEMAEQTKKLNSNESASIQLMKSEYEKQLRTIKSCSTEPEYLLKKEGVIGFDVNVTLKDGKKLHFPASIALYKNGKGKTGICIVHMF